MCQCRKAERYGARRSFVTFVAHVEKGAMIFLCQLNKIKRDFVSNIKLNKSKQTKVGIKGFFKIKRIITIIK